MNLIVAASNNEVIGKNNELLWRLPDDLKRFRYLTQNHTVVMGRKTWESLPFKPLPHRRNIVLTRDKTWSHPGVFVCHSVEEVLKLTSHEIDVFVIGGDQIYELFLPHCSKIYLTRVHVDIEGDSYFRFHPNADWDLIESSNEQCHNNTTYHYETWAKKTIQ